MEETWQVRCKTAKKTRWIDTTGNWNKNWFPPLGQEPLEKLLWLLYFFFHSSPRRFHWGGGLIHKDTHTHAYISSPSCGKRIEKERGNGFSFISSAILSLSLSPISLSIYSSCCCGFEYCQIMWKKRAQALNNKKKGGSQNNLSGSEIVFFLFLE